MSDLGPTDAEMDEIWANRLDKDQLIENLPSWYKADVTVASINLKDITGNVVKARATVLFGQLAELLNLGLTTRNEQIEIERPKTREELEYYAKYALHQEMRKERKEAAEQGEVGEIGL